MLGFLLKKPHRTAVAAVALLSAIATGIPASSSPPSNQTRKNLCISLPLRNLWEDIGITSLFPVSSGGWGFPSKHHFFGSSNQPTDSNKDNCKCRKGCLSKNSIANAASAVAPAVVNISILSKGDVMKMGSGIIIEPDGWILTSAHVVAECNNGKPIIIGTNVIVKLQDGRNFDGYVVSADCHSDVAIVKIRSYTPLPTARLGNSAQLRPGDWVVAVGCPFYLQNTITAGIVSCVNRQGSDISVDQAGREFIQTDCATNKGSAGGPLVNLDGEIVGMNVIKAFNADGVSFAVPIDIVTKIIEPTRKRSKLRRWLGLKMVDLDSAIISQLKERDLKFPDVISGILVPAVTPGSPGDCARFQVHDVVISFDGKPVKSINKIVNIMDERQGIKYINLSVVPEEAKSN